MAGEIVRPSALITERTSPVASEWLVTDNGSTVAKVTIQKAVEAGRPSASQAEAEAGVDAAKAMTPLATKQAIDTQVPPKIAAAIAALELGSASQSEVSDFATSAQGAKADSAVQSIGAGSGIAVDASDPLNPIVSYTGAGIADINPPQGRLSLTSDVALPSSDVTGATTIYYVPNGGPYVPLFDGTAFSMKKLSGQLVLPLTSNAAYVGYHQSGRNFDLFVINDAGTLRLCTGPSWNAGAVAGSDTTRGTGAGSSELEVVNGVLVNKNAITIRFGSASGNTVAVAARQATYLGSFRTVADGQAADTRRQRLLFNAYNIAIRPIGLKDATASTAYSTNAWRQYNGDANNQIEILAGLVGTAASVNAFACGTTSTATARNLWTAIGLDSTAPAADQLNPGCGTVSGSVAVPTAKWDGLVGLGFHSLKWLQRGAGADTQTWLGTPGLFDVGLSGDVAL